MDENLAALLRRLDTPTVCNAIEVAQGRRGFTRFTRGTILASDPKAPAMFGRARTAIIAGAEPASDPIETVRRRRMDYYRHMAGADGRAITGPAVAIVQDLDAMANGPGVVGAFWGEVNVAIHRGFGLGGVLTDGVMRDLNDLEEGFPILAGSVGPSHGFVHVRESAIPVTVFGLTVSPGELIHADRHGAVVIPEEVLPVLAQAVAKLQAAEKLVLHPARAPGFDFETFEAAWAAFEAVRT